MRPLRPRKLYIVTVTLVMKLPIKNQEADVNYAIKNLLADGFEIIEITHDNIGMMASTFRHIYTITDITYGKPKNNKK